MDATTAALVDFSLRSNFAALPKDTVHETVRRLIDAFGCAMGAFDEALCRSARTLASEVSGKSKATVWGTDIVTTPDAAAFANGVMVRYLDISDTFFGVSRGHPSDMISAVLAVAEAEKSDGKSVINAVALAYDVYCSFCTDVDINSKGWDQPTYSILGAVAGAGKLMNLNREQMGEAIALALAPNMALFQTRQGDISAWKGCAGANASRNAVFAATIARAGFTGPTAVFEGKGGMMDIVGKFTWNLPKGEHLIGQTHMKPLAVCYHGQSSILAALELRPKLVIDDIAEIRIDSYKAAVAMMGIEKNRWAPTTRETADHSMPYCVAIALLDGEISGKSFDEKRFSEPAVVALMQKVKVSEDPALNEQYPEGSPGRVTIRMKNGEVHKCEIRYPAGHARNPMDDRTLEAKFRDMLSARATTDQANRMLKRLWDFEKLTDIAQAIRLMAHPAEA